MKKLVAVLAILVVLGLGGWLVASKVVSPAQVAARAEPPPPVPVTAPLQKGYLHAPISLNAKAQYENSLAVQAPAAITGVVTHIEDVLGQAVGSGDDVMRVNGRPVFLLAGQFALYRDIDPGAAGDDVAAVQEGLRAAGYSTGRDKTGTYGTGTQAAIRKLYRNAGQSAPEVPLETQPASAPVAEGQPARVAPVVTGPRIAQSELLMIHGLPAVVQSVAPVGTQVTGDTALFTLSGGSMTLSATVPTSSLGALAVGAQGTLTDSSGQSAAAQLTSIAAAASGTDSILTFTTPSQVQAGTDYVITVENPANEDGQTLLAPMAAVVSRGGGSYVYVNNGGTFVEVPVTVVGSVGGVAGIEPGESAVPLEAGTEVKVG